LWDIPAALGGNGSKGWLEAAKARGTRKHVDAIWGATGTAATRFVLAIGAISIGVGFMECPLLVTITDVRARRGTETMLDWARFFVMVSSAAMTMTTPVMVVSHATGKFVDDAALRDRLDILVIGHVDWRTTFTASDWSRIHFIAPIDNAGSRHALSANHRMGSLATRLTNLAIIGLCVLGDGTVASILASATTLLASMMTTTAVLAGTTVLLRVL
jgi:hypothetical protein